MLTGSKRGHLKMPQNIYIVKKKVKTIYYPIYSESLDCYKQVHVSKDISLYNSISNEHWIEIWNSYFFILLLMRNCDCPIFVFVLLWFVALQTFTNISLIHFYFYVKLDVTKKYEKF